MFNQREKNKNNSGEKYLEDAVGGDGGSDIYIYIYTHIYISLCIYTDIYTQ